MDLETTLLEDRDQSGLRTTLKSRTMPDYALTPCRQATVMHMGGRQQRVYFTQVLGCSSFNFDSKSIQMRAAWLLTDYKRHMGLAETSYLIDMKPYAP